MDVNSYINPKRRKKKGKEHYMRTGLSCIRLL